ncbi:MAG: phosphoribosylanthranilate isomerase, partial [Candidatus Jordarchaeales archaeon]
MRTRVKICGVKSVEDLHMVVEAGVDAVGFVVDVPSSPRSLAPSEARSLVRATPVFVETVAVTVPRSVDHLKKIVDLVNPDAVQVHGLRVNGELRDAVAGVKLIAAVQATQSSPELALEVASYCDAILVDTPGEMGGTGRTHDWSISRKIRDLVHPKPLILAGGLN